MDLISAVASMVGIAQGFFEIKDKLRNKKESEALGGWLVSTGDLLAGVVSSVRDGIYPYAKCSQLNYTLTHLSTYVEDLFEKEQFLKIKEMIAEAHKVEQMFVELNNIPDSEKEKNLNKLEESVGVFYSLSSFVKLG